MKSEAFDLDSIEWKPVRQDVADGVYGKTVLDEFIKIVHTRVKPGGGFSPHEDSYAHLLYFLSGSGIVGVGKQRLHARTGLVVHISAGEEHFYQNTGDDDLILISLNIPVVKRP
jgi:quercetin dioxygenase-like cupin family protein